MFEYRGQVPPEKGAQEQEKKLSMPYDTTFKHWLARYGPEIVSALFPSMIYEDVLEEEVMRPMMRVDKVFKVRYDGIVHILHLEVQTRAESHFPARLLSYTANLHCQYHLPVITIVVYPFETTVAQSPFRMWSQGQETVTFHFQTLLLFELDAEACLNSHWFCLYLLLPTMQGFNAALLDQAMEEMMEFYKDDQGALGEQFLSMLVLLQRSGTIPKEEKPLMEKRLRMFDQIWEESPIIQEIRAGSEQKGRMQTLQRTLINCVESKYPKLADLAQLRAARTRRSEELEPAHSKFVPRR